MESVEANGSASLSPALDFRAWTALTDADFSRNDLPYIDESVVNAMCYIINIILHAVPENPYSPPPSPHRQVWNFQGGWDSLTSKKLMRDARESYSQAVYPGLASWKLINFANQIYHSFIIIFNVELLHYVKRGTEVFR